MTMIVKKITRMNNLAISTAVRLWCTKCDSEIYEVKGEIKKCKCGTWKWIVGKKQNKWKLFKNK